MKKEINKKFRIINSNHIVIDLRLNNVYGKFIVDTGASNSCVDFFSIKKFNININKSKEIASSATGDIEEIFHSEKNILQIDNYIINDIKMMVFDMTHINNSLKNNDSLVVDGIIGGDFLKKFSATLDYTNKILKLKL